MTRKRFEITINPAEVPPPPPAPDPIAIVTESPLPDGEVGAGYFEAIESTGGSGSYVYLLIGALPDGLTLDADGFIHGIPTASGTTSFEVEVTDVPVTEPVPEPVTDEPVFSPATGTMVYEDDMDAYTTVEDMGAQPFGGPARIVPHPSPLTVSRPVNASETALVTGRGGSGKALRMIYSGVKEKGGTFLLYRSPSSGNQDTNFFQYWVRINFSTPYSRPVAVKWFQAWHNSGNGRMQWNTHNHLPCPAAAHATYWQVLASSQQTTCQANQPVGPYFNDLQDNEWHRYTYEFRPHSSEGAGDGIGRMWIDGTKIIDISQAAMGVTPPDGEKTWCELDDLDALEVANGIRQLWWGGVPTETTPPWTLDVDDLLWWTVK